jgi:CheY-like chemotaxis protein
MHQVLMNLCANAEQAMRQTGGILEIQLTTVEVPRQFRTNHLDLRPGRYQCLTVKDTGLGMPLEVLERVFDPFFTTKEPGEGTGMGLAVVHGIVGSHGGAVDVSSIPGKGTKFDIYLPLCDVQEEEFQPQDPIPRGEGVVLFVDDETSLAGLGREMLLALGYEAVVTTNGREALEIFHADPYRYHVVITDQTMPEMTGQALAMKILAIRPEIPIILCTGFSHVMSSEKAKKIGIKEFLMKPVGLADLAQALASVLSTTVKEKVR